MFEMEKFTLKILVLISIVIQDKNFIQASCPDGLGWSNIGDNCAKVQEEKRGWNEAYDVCQKKSGKLASILNDQQNENLVDALDEGDFWIGAHIPPLVFDSYFNRCPDGHGYRNISCFQVHPEFITWKESLKKCSDLGGKLATIPDEETNVFVGKAMFEMVRSRDLLKIRSDSEPPSLSYWIDGYTRDNSPEFFDSSNGTLMYTNFKSPQSQNEKACIEVTAPMPRRQTAEEPDLDELLRNAEDDAMKEAIKGLPGEIPADMLPKTPNDEPDSNDPPDVAEDYIPKYKAIKCDERRLAVCEFSLRIRENSSSSETVKKISPSRLQSCMDLAILSIYSDTAGALEQMYGEGVKSKEKRRSVLSEYQNLTSNFYILEKKDSSKPSDVEQSDNTTFTESYELAFCDIDRMRTNLTDQAFDGKELFKWLKSNREKDKSIVQLDFLSDRNSFNGPCMLITESGEWNTSDCTEKNHFVCQYSTQAIKDHFCDDSPNESWCIDDDDSLERLNEESKKLFDNLTEKSRDFIFEGSPSSSNLRKLILRAKKFAIEKLPMLKNRSQIVKNFTSNILNSASILLDPELAYYQNSQENIRSVIDAINLLAEYTADVYSSIQDGNKSDPTTISLNSSWIHFQVVMVEANTKEEDFNKSMQYISPSGQSVQMILTENARKMCRNFGATFINVQYSNLGRESYTPRRLAMITEYSSIDQKDFLLEPSFRGDMFSIMASDLQTATLRINGTNHPTSIKLAMNKKFPDIELRKVDGSEICAFLQEYNTTDEIGMEWSTKGCHMVNTDGSYTCECNHTTDFAVLLLVYNPADDILDGHRNTLSILSIIGHALSIICLFISIALFTALKRDMKSDRWVIHLNLFIALFFATIALLTSQITRRTGVVSSLDDGMYETENPGCAALTFFNHYLLLSSISWMLIEGIVIYRKIVVVISRQRKVFNNIYYFVGWGMPLIVAVIPLLIGILTDISYHSEGCWLSVRSGTIWAFAGPVIAIILINSVILIMVLRVAMRTQKRKVARRADASDSDKSKMTRMAYLKTTARGLLVLTPLLGSTWMLGLFAYHVSVAYLFVLLNALQGVLIFVFYCVCNPEIRAALDMKWKHYKARHFTPMHEEKPLAGTYSGGPRNAGWLKTKLFMRLSFTSTSSRPQDKFNSVQRNSEVIAEADESENDKQIPISKLSSESPLPRKVDSRDGNRKSSALTRSTQPSNDHDPSSPIKGTPNLLSKKLNRKKLTAKIEPLDTDDNSLSASDNRPSTADGIFSTRKRDIHAWRMSQRVKKPSPLHDGLEDVKPPFRKKLSRQFAYGGDIELERSESPSVSSFYDDISDERSDDEECYSDGSIGGMDNPGLISDGDEELIAGNPPENKFTQEYRPETIKTISRKTSDLTCDLCCQEYYNVLGQEDTLDMIYSDVYSRQNNQRRNRRETPRRPDLPKDICISRCCPRCRPDRKRSPITIRTYGKPKTNYKKSSHLEVIKIAADGKFLEEERYRPKSGESMDSGILPDGIEGYSITDSL